MAVRSAFAWIFLFVLAVPLMGGAQAQTQSVWQPIPSPINFPDILFSISPGKTTWWPPVGDGDELSSLGVVVAANATLLRNFSPPVTVAAVDYGLDALQEMSWGPIAAAAPVTYFSVNKGFQDQKLGWISDGDLLADTGNIVARNKDLLATFGPVPGDMGLDAAFVPYFLPTPAADKVSPPEIWFSTVRGWYCSKLDRWIGDGDLLSSRGYVVATNAQLLRNFHPVQGVTPLGGVLPPATVDYGLDAVCVPFYRPWYGTAVTNAVSASAGVIVNPLPLDIWFSVKKGFTDKYLGEISDGDLLSTSGRIVRRNADLLARFDNPTMSPVQANYGLDAVYVRGRKVIRTYPPMDTTVDKVADNKVQLVFDGPVSVPADGAVTVTAADGQDVTAAFDVSLATTTTPNDTVVITERGAALADTGQYRIQPADALAVEPFILDVAKLVGDVNGDGSVDVADLLSLVDSFGQGTGDSKFDPACDFNNDGSVDVVDLLTFVTCFGK